MRFVSLVLGLGLEHSCPWPRECLSSSERLSLALALASDFFCVLGLGLEPCVLDSTSGVRVLAISVSVQFQYNTTLPSSAVVERLFSLGKDILKPKRCGLSDEHFEMLTFEMLTFLKLISVFKIFVTISGYF